MGLFGGKENLSHPPAVDCIIGSNASVKGELVSTGSVQISGRFEGKLDVAGELIIAPGSKVTGDIRGHNVIVSGEVDSNITATHALELTKTGRVHGDLVGGKVTIEEGCSYSGRVAVNAVEEVAGDSIRSSDPNWQS